MKVDFQTCAESHAHFSYQLYFGTNNLSPVGVFGTESPEIAKLQADGSLFLSYDLPPQGLALPIDGASFLPSYPGQVSAPRYSADSGALTGHQGSGSIRAAFGQPAIACRQAARLRSEQSCE